MPNLDDLKDKFTKIFPQKKDSLPMAMSSSGGIGHGIVDDDDVSAPGILPEFPSPAEYLSIRLKDDHFETRYRISRMPDLLYVSSNVLFRVRRCISGTLGHRTL
jgi:hypothetical protein